VIYILMCVFFRIYRHAGRDIIDVKDVMLLARRNESLEMLLREGIEEAAKSKAKGKASSKR